MRFVLVCALALAGCGSSEEPAASEAAPAAETGSTGGEVVIEDTGNALDDPRISRSAGQEGGVVVLWPRVVGALDSSTAMAVQERLRAIAERVYAGQSIDVRPDPERTCPRQGCAGASLGALLVGTGSGCTVLGLVSEAGPSRAHIVQWVGNVNIREPYVAFREPPESHVQIVDFTPCDELSAALGAGEARIEEALRAAR